MYNEQNYEIGTNNYENIMLKRRVIPKTYMIGIDEAGRGPLAGAVFVGAVLLPIHYKQLFRKTNVPSKLADSKKLTPAQREKWFLWIQRNVLYAYASVSARQIDTINISQASNIAAQRAYNALIKKYKTSNKASVNRLANQNIMVVADGGLKVKVDTKSTFQHYPKADELLPAVSLASIVAKVLRDKYMLRMHKKYPLYKFNKHKGYGTKKHYQAIKKYGPSSLHRLTFLESLHTIKKRSK